MRTLFTKSVQLGALLGGSDDLRRQTPLARAAMSALYPRFVRRGKIGLRKRINSYNAYVLPELDAGV